jgi:F0F1-type ATP synthase membrane subunit b/b'
MIHFIDESGWFLISFVIFILLAYKPIKNVILSFLDNKIASIKDALSKISSEKQDVENKLKMLEEEIQSAEKDLSNILLSTKLELEARYQEKCADLKRKLDFKYESMSSYLLQSQRDSITKIEQKFLSLVIKEVTEIITSHQNSKLDLKILKNDSI